MVPPAGGPSGPVSGKQGPVVLPARRVSTPTDERTMVIAGAIKVFVEVSPLP